MVYLLYFDCYFETDDHVKKRPLEALRLNLYFLSNLKFIVIYLAVSFSSASAGVATATLIYN